MINNYIKYLEFIDEKLDKFFKSQKPYIFCKKGCAECCKNAQFPYSLIEIKYLLNGFIELDKTVQDKIEKNTLEVLKKKKKYKGKNFTYDCPFLIDNSCSVYKYRGVVCRAFGLITNNENGKVKAPFCSHKGLNYSNVLNLRTKTISAIKFKKLGVEEEPLGFNTSYQYLTDADFENTFNFKFGELKSLIDWLVPEEN